MNYFVSKLINSILSFLTDSNIYSPEETMSCFIIHQRQLMEPVRPKNVPKLDLSFLCDSEGRKINGKYNIASAGRHVEKYFIAENFLCPTVLSCSVFPVFTQPLCYGQDTMHFLQ